MTIKNYFTEAELSCPCCGVNGFKQATLDKFNLMRHEAGFAINMTSGYRCPEYNKLKGYTQTHATGQAGDVSCHHAQAVRLTELGHKHGMTGFGVKQHGEVRRRFLHFDDLPNELPKQPRPTQWSYR